VVADDLTGAGDLGLMFARHGWVTRIFTAGADLDQLPRRLSGQRADVVILDADARFDAMDTATAKVQRATAALARWGADVFCAKTFPGQCRSVGIYVDAMLNELGRDFGLAVAAYPHPEPGMVTELAAQADGRVERLPLEAVRSGHVALLSRIDDARKHHVRYLLADVENEDDVGALADAALAEPVLLGSSAIVETLARHWPTPPPFDPFGASRPARGGGVLVIAGSQLPETRAQVAALVEAGLHTVSLSAEAALDGCVGTHMGDVARRLQRGEHVLVRAEAVEATRALGASRGLGEPETSRRVLATLAAFSEAAVGRLVALGGDTSAAVCRHLRIEELVVLDEVAPGLPATLATQPRPLLLVLKSGGYGGPDFGLKAIAHLEGICRGLWT
jgi:uncharacterized protein YgbK (DUF1537 family)